MTKPIPKKPAAKKPAAKKTARKPNGPRAGSAISFLSSMAVGETRYVEFEREDRMNIMHRYNPAAQHRPADMLKWKFQTRAYVAFPVATSLIDAERKCLLEITRLK